MRTLSNEKFTYAFVQMHGKRLVEILRETRTVSKP